MSELIRRRKIFSSNPGNQSTKRRISLFSKPEVVEEEEKVITPETELEKVLRKLDGKVLTEAELIEELKYVGLSPSELEERGLVEQVMKDETGVSYLIQPSAFLQPKLFSKLTVTITRELDLPDISDSREAIFKKLMNTPSIVGGERGVTLIKKAHGISPTDFEGFNENPELCKEHQDWVTDSGILKDLVFDFGPSKSMNVEEFNNLISKNYKDCPIPDKIVHVLIKRGVVRPMGSGMIELV